MDWTEALVVTGATLIAHLDAKPARVVVLTGWAEPIPRTRIQHLQEAVVELDRGDDAVLVDVENVPERNVERHGQVDILYEPKVLFLVHAAVRPSGSDEGAAQYI